jgi:predicted esterase
VRARHAALAALSLFCVAAAARGADAPSESALRIAPGPRGQLGAWLLLGPFPAAKTGAFSSAPSGVDEKALRPFAGLAVDASRRDGARAVAPPKWTMASSRDGAIDLRDAFDKPKGPQIAYAGVVVHVERGGVYHLCLSGDDGVEVWLDGRAGYRRDASRPPREDDDVVPLDLTPGDHVLVLKLHQRDAGWSLRARLVDEAFERPARAYVELPGTPRGDAASLVAQLSRVSVELAPRARAGGVVYEPKLTVRFAGGAPKDAPALVRAKLDGDDAFDVSAGEVATEGREAAELVAWLPRASPRGADAAIEVQVGDRKLTFPFPSRGRAERAFARATAALARAPRDAPFMREGSRVSVEHGVARLAGALSSADRDDVALDGEAQELDALAAAMEAGRDPYDARPGATRRAWLSPLDGAPSEVGVYVPASYTRALAAGTASDRKWPLVVTLHGLNGKPMAMLRWLFGGDDPKRPGPWEERHFMRYFPTAPALDAFVISPEGHANAMYREMGEEDVLGALAWARRRYPIDDARITITGPSMGGIGSAGVPLHHPEVFAGAAPLCGYHSYFIRRDIRGRPMRPWERLLAEERSNVFWADNGARLPLYVVHGTRDLPQENSGVLIDRYKQLGFSIKHEHPDLGHNVWKTTFEDLKGARWLLSRRRGLHPKDVHLRATRPRWGDAAWVHVRALESPGAWSDVRARVSGRGKLVATTRNTHEISFDRDAALLDDGAVRVELDGRPLDFAASEPLVAHRDDAGAWTKGASTETPTKRGHVTGPIRDAFHEPLLFVYAASPREEARVNEAVARAFASVRPGVRVDYPVMSDAEFAVRGESLANERALFLVGRTNAVLAALEQAGPLPIHVRDGAVEIGSERITGPEVGAAFVHPNPVRPDRYVVVLAGASAAGTMRARSLPDLLPDFVVWDEHVAPSRGQLLLGGGQLRAAGLFTRQWRLPKSFVDPLARAKRPQARSEDDDNADLP